MHSRNPYPVPRETGGTIIRKALALLKEKDDVLPPDSHILIACSGGADSVALAHLMVHFGRRIVSRARIQLLHIDHQWRGAESSQDAEFVKSLAENWGVPFILRRVEGPQSYPEGVSWEAEARSRRKAIFAEESAKLGDKAVVFTAHQRDDLAETVLWRICTGSFWSHGAGILVRDGNEVRPFLNVSREEIENYLSEEGVLWRKDSSNDDRRFMRARVRSCVLPELKKVFPKGLENLALLGLECQGLANGFETPEDLVQGIEALVSQQKLTVSLKTINALQSMRTNRNGAPSSRRVLLKDGWQIKYVAGGKKHANLTNLESSPSLTGGTRAESWVLEKR